MPSNHNYFGEYSNNEHLTPLLIDTHTDTNPEAHFNRFISGFRAISSLYIYIYICVLKQSRFLFLEENKQGTISAPHHLAHVRINY